MALYAYVTPACEEDAQHHGQLPLVKNLRGTVENSQNLTGFGFFFPTAFLKRSLGRSFRLLAYRVPVHDDELILFLRVLSRGGKDYEYFLENWDKHTSEVVSRFMTLTDSDIRSIYADLTAVGLPARHPEPSEEEQAWLYEVFRTRSETDDLLVLETRSWVQKMRSEDNREFLALYHRTLEQIDTATLPSSDTSSSIHVYHDDRTRLGFAYIYRRDWNRLLFLEPLRHGEDGEAVTAAYRDVLARAPDTVEGLSRLALRSYPFLIILDQSSWLAIQKDEEANLALSPEEADLLESINTMGAAGTLGYPLFINGRAGSGKSTMLQYLAADYVEFALRHQTQGLPLYMTCSRDLLERARTTVFGLLTTHHERLLNERHDGARVKDLLDRTFVVFHDFLYSLLTPDQQRGLKPTRYVSYSGFRRLWATQYAKRADAGKVPADVAWHTIRSYIKGIRSGPNDEMDVAGFEELPRDRRSVSLETFKHVYERVWCSWYKRLCEEEGFWDDQDLAANVLDSGGTQNVGCTALICDEAQDFTPIELDIIFQLPVFSRRSLQPEQLARVPIVFAGDPLQTINPTGFRWDSVQADFHDKFCAILDPRRRSKVALRYEELHLNYRSNPGIVNFCNLIQLVRRSLLQSKDIRPQKTWWVDQPVQPVWFRADTPATGEQLKRRPELIKIVNCEEGEESDFVRADTVLTGSLTEEKGVYFNVLGPTRAKGLEWPIVALYRFGESVPKAFSRALEGDLDLTVPESRLPLEYFFNRLYVAASRAKGQLIILDSEEALREFWRFATDMELVEALMPSAGGEDLWRDSIMYLGPGTDETWRGERVDLAQQGMEYAGLGRRNRDPYLMRQAALAFRSAGDDFEAGRCLAQAIEFDGKFGEAGHKYVELGLDEDAFRCFWRGHSWRDLCSLTAHKPGLSFRLESRAADFLTSPGKPTRSFLDSLLEATREDAWVKQAVEDAAWQETFTALGERLSSYIGDREIPWINIQQALVRLKSVGANLKSDHMAAVAYGAKDFDSAARLWEETGSTDREEYRRAKANTSAFPDRLVWLGALRENADIIKLWKENESTITAVEKVDDAVFKAILDAALAQSDLQLARSLVEQRLSHDRAVALLAVCIASKRDPEIASAAALLARSLVREREWSRAVKFAETNELEGVKLPDARALIRAKAGPEVLRATVQELALSPHLTSAAVEQQEAVARFLSRQFISKGNAWTKEQRGITVEMAGAAIERAGKIVDALQFYESFERDGTTDDIKRFAAERLIRNLERHAEYLQSRNDEGQRQRQRQRAQQLRERLRIGDRKVADYPSLGPTHGTPVPSPTEWTRGPFKIILSRTHGRVRIEHTGRFETITVDGKEQRLLGDATFAPTATTGEQSAAWEIADWVAKVTLVERGGGRVVVFDDGSPFEISVG